MYQLFFILIVIITFDGKQTSRAEDSHSPCTNLPPGQIGPDLPELPCHYETRVEVNIVQKTKTIEVLEWYDFPNKRVALHLIKDNVVMKSIINYNSSERYDIVPGLTCNAADIGSSDNFNIFGFTMKGKNGKLHIASVKDVFKFGRSYNETYVGEDVIRGIPVNHWVSCQHSEQLHATFRLDYFFSCEPYKTSRGHSNVPIRAVIKGYASNVDQLGKIQPGTHNFNHVYEFSVFIPGPIRDPRVFETPRGIVCHGRKNTKRMPSIPDQFTVDMEVTGVDGRIQRNQRVYFDYNFKLVRIDHYFPVDHNKRYGPGMFTQIDDYIHGVEYIIDKVEGNCSTQPIPATMFSSRVSGAHNIAMRHAEGLLTVKNKTFVYQGQRTWRGLLVDAWANISKDGHVQEVYFSQVSPYRGIGRRSKPVLVGQYLINSTSVSRQPNAPSSPQKQQPNCSRTLGDLRQMDGSQSINIFNFIPGHPDLNAFDISQCYRDGTKELYLKFAFTGHYKKDVYGMKSIVYSSLRTAIAKAAQVSPLRVASMQVMPSTDTKDKLVVTFSLLDKIPVFGAGKVSQISVDEAHKNLAKAVAEGLPITIYYPGNPHKLVYRIIHLNSLTASTQPASQQTDKRDYSPGAMAGLGIGMAVLGTVVGLLIAFIIYRRINPDIQIPYMKWH